MGFNSAFKGLISELAVIVSVIPYYKSRFKIS
jgi:hypothetical protein